MLTWISVKMNSEEISHISQNESIRGFSVISQSYIMFLTTKYSPNSVKILIVNLCLYFQLLTFHFNNFYLLIGLTLTL